MIELDYWTLLSPPDQYIYLTIGKLRKPTLREIGVLSFDRFNFFEVLSKLTPELYYTKVLGEQGKSQWNSMSDSAKDDMTIYRIICDDARLQQSYVDLLNFFFVEHVMFQDEYFVLIDESLENPQDYTVNDIHGVIAEDSLLLVLDVIQQICCIKEEDENPPEQTKFKNKTAQKWFEKMRKGKKEEKKLKKADDKYSLPNLISAVSNRHPSLNYLNIYDLTVFQLTDAFRRLQANAYYDISSTAVSVWGDEKKTFDDALWYKNEFKHSKPTA